MAELKSVKQYLSDRVATLKRRQEARVAHLREVEQLIEQRGLEIHNLESQLKEWS